MIPLAQQFAKRAGVSDLLAGLKDKAQSVGSAATQTGGGIMDYLRPKLQDAGKATSEWTQQHPDATKALLGALAGGTLAGGMTAFSDPTYGETRGQKRMRTLRNALLGAGLGGGAVAALQYGGRELANALPTNAKDPMDELGEKIRSHSADALSSLPVQLIGARAGVRLHNGGKPMKDRALETLHGMLTGMKPGAGPVPDPSGSAFDSWLRHPSNPLRSAPAGDAASWQRIEQAWKAHHQPPEVAALHEQLSKLPATEAGKLRDKMNVWFNNKSLFDANPANTGKPPTPGELAQKAMQHIAKLDPKGEEAMKELMRRSGIHYRHNSTADAYALLKKIPGIRNLVGGRSLNVPMPANLWNSFRGALENSGIPTGRSADPHAWGGFKPKALERVGGGSARGRAGMAGALGLLLPGIMANLARGEFRAGDYVPDIPGLGRWHAGRAITGE